jgi:hypothetical protein
MELYKQGYEVVCRDPSIKVVNVFETGCEENPIGATLEKNGKQSVRIYETSCGEYCEASEENIDLFLKKKEKWVNIWMKDGEEIFSNNYLKYESREGAEEASKKCIGDHITWVGAIKLPDSV